MDYHETGLLKGRGEEVLDALRAVTVCDPACGSGAYLLGMLHELTLLRAVLFDTTELDALTAYERKLSIIHNNLYGVDLEPFAVNIARLRLWLSLAVEYEGPNPPALPNLDFKIECGDSLLGPKIERVSGRQGELWGDDDQIENWARGLAKQKQQFMKATGAMKDRLREAILKQERRIAESMKESKYRREDGKPVFFWRIQFFEVFARGGFDVMLANPPYVRQEGLGVAKKRLEVVFPEVYAGTADLFCYFYARAIEGLRAGGMLVFISSNKWFKAEYGANLRAHVLNTCHVRDIIDFGDLPVFESAIAYPMIFIAQRQAPDATDEQAPARCTRVPSLDPPYPDVHTTVKEKAFPLTSDALTGARYILLDERGMSRIRKMESTGITLGQYVGNRIYRGLLTGFNEAFFIEGEAGGTHRARPAQRRNHQTAGPGQRHTEVAHRPAGPVGHLRPSWHRYQPVSRH